MTEELQQPSGYLDEVNVDHCELVGYRRLGKSSVGVLLPVFANASACRSLLYQRRGDEGRIAGFVGDPHLKSDQVISISDQGISVRIGDELLHIYIAHDGQLICAQGQHFRAELEKLIASPDALHTPFKSLEIARFLRMPAMEKRFGSLCFKSLSATSKSLAISWMAGRNLSPEARNGAYQELVKLDPTSDVSSNIREKSNKVFENTPTHPPDPHREYEIDFSQPLDALRAHGFTLRRRQEIEAAIFIFRGILERFPTRAQSWLDLAHVLRKAERNSEAYQLYTSLVERFPNEIEKIAEAIVSIRKMGRHRDALELCGSLVERFPNNPNPLMAMAELCADTGDNISAAKAYRAALDSMNLDSRTATKIVRRLSHIIDRSEVVPLAAELEDRYPKSSQVKKLVAELFFRCGLKDQSIRAYQRAIEVDPTDNTSKIALARLYANLNMHQEAVDLYQQLNSTRSKLRRRILRGLIDSLEALGRSDAADQMRDQLRKLV